ncbi:MAG TPA: metallopeptidase TldD-related protein [Candidatus Polarisedimenticolaceae bacterium]|nr:metallopeptidase TldD-related protein [Candidatus Polarisedimenticolaceae bacterium]
MDLSALVSALGGAREDGCFVDAWSVAATEARRLTLGTKDARTGSPHAPLALSESLAARFKIVWSDGRISRGVLDRRQIEQDAASTLREARLSSYDDPDAKIVLGPAAFPDVAVFDPGVDEIAGGAVEPLAPRLTAIRARVAAHGFRTWSGSLQAARATARVVTSEGLDVEALGTSWSWHATFDGEIGTGISRRSQDDDASFDARLDRVIPAAVALRADAPKRAGGILPVLFHPDVVEELFVAALLHNLDGAAVTHGTGAFRREQFASRAVVLREDLTLRHDPLVPLAAGAYRFTQEGLPARAVTYVSEGRLVSPLLDTKYARRLGLSPTPAPSAIDTVFFEGPAPLPYAAAAAEAAGGALVLGVLGVHTQDFTSGDFSMSAPQTLAMGAGGRFEGRLRSTISGNVFALLRSPALRLVAFPGEHTPGVLAPCRLDPV